MERSFKLFAGLLVVAASLAGACQVLTPAGADPNQVATESQMLIDSGRATASVAAFYTQVAEQNNGTSQPTTTSESIIVSTNTPIPPSATIITRPSATPFPTPTPVPSFTRSPPTATPSITPLPIPCDRATFVADVTIPDGTVISPGATFTKTWRLKNSGTCTWTTSYSLVFVSGEQMKASSPIPLSADVTPGNTVDLSVVFTAPTGEGEYRNNWKLKNANGVQFGVGSSGNSSFYVVIQVKNTTSGYNIDFVGSYCNAEWSSGAGNLPCPGASGDARGYVQRIDYPILENGYKDDEPALLTVPQAQTDGVIRGKYPLYTVQSGDRFRAIIGCANGASSCSVKFELAYIVDGETAIQSVASWIETYDGNSLSVDQDLSSLVGKKVRFILTVFANGEMKDDRALWLAPRVVKP